jgi:aspartyl-tRNA(Asn)/glutamyl-tRNA(Gln) amidotransferase subunit C
MSISESDVRHVASLARLELTDERIPSLVSEMNRILDYVGVLQRVEMSPMASHAEQLGPAPLRPDEPGSVPLERPLAEFAPAERDGFLLVPRLASHA